MNNFQKKKQENLKKKIKDENKKFKKMFKPKICKLSKIIDSKKRLKKKRFIYLNRSYDKYISKDLKKKIRKSVFIKSLKKKNKSEFDGNQGLLLKTKNYYSNVNINFKKEIFNSNYFQKAKAMNFLINQI